MHDPIRNAAQTRGIPLHCLVLTLIGLVATAVGLVLLPPAEPRQGAMVRAAAPAHLKATAWGKAAPAPGTSESEDKPFSYVPAQLPTPRDDADHRLPSF